MLFVSTCYGPPIKTEQQTDKKDKEREMFRQAFKVGLLVMALCFVDIAFAQMPVKGTLGMEAGEYDINNYNQSDLERNYLDKFSDRQIEQKSFVSSTVNSINESFKLLIKDALLGETESLEVIATKSKAGESTNYLDFLTVKMRYERHLANIELLLGSITKVPGAIKSVEEANAGKKGLVKLPGLVSGETIDFGPLLAHYRNQIDGYNKMLREHQYYINVFNEMPKWVNFDYEGPEVKLSAHEIGKLRDKAFAIRTGATLDSDGNILHAEKRRHRRTLDALTHQAIKQVHQITTQHGTEEKWRLITEQQQEIINKNLSDVEEIFWARSRLRMVFGMQIGTFNIDYSKAKFHADVILTKTKDLVAFQTPHIWEQAKLVALRDAAYHAKNRLIERTAKVNFNLKKFQIYEEGTPFLNQIATTTTFLTGNRPLANIKAWLVELIANDIEEENLVARARWGEMIARYKLRYGGTKERRARFSKVRKAIDPKDMGSAPGSFSLDTTMGAFQAGKNSLEKRLDYLWVADQIEAEIVMATNANSRHKNREDLEEIDF